MRKAIFCFLVIPLVLSATFSCTRSDPFEVSDFTDSVFTAGIEGPMAYVDGNIYVVNYRREGTIGLVKPDGNCELFIELPEGSIGNGIRFSSQGDMFVADYKSHSILKISMQTKAISIHAHHAAMNQPNDLAIMNDTLIFCSDPNWSDGTGNLWRVHSDGRVVLLMSGMGTTNGIELSPDNKFLYVNESVQRIVWRFELNEKGDLLTKQLFFAFEDGGLDGMKCDAQGNLWVARYDKGMVVKLSQEGRVKKEVLLKGQKPTNLTFGGEKGKTVFVTLQDRKCIEKFELE